ncbi:MAG: Mov34/MPN/PAD-1 family protein [Thermomicrobiales bacterium]
MIAWSEQKPDFSRAPLDELSSRLPFTAACIVALNPGPWPLVAARKDTMDSVWAHLAEQSVEMGGLLIGSVHDLSREGSRFVIAISDHVRSVEFDGTGVSLRMDPEVWERARLKAGEGRFVVGWYHSHPNLGVFFSGTDRRTQRAFFYHPHSAGVVIDPVRREEKWFVGGDSDELSPRQILRYQ